MRKGEDNVTYTKFTVVADAKKEEPPTPVRKEKTIFFDAAREPTVRRADANIRIRTKRERGRKSARKFKRTLAGLVRCVVIVTAAVILAAIPLALLGIIGFDDGTLRVGAHSFSVGNMSGDFVDFLHEKETVPASGVISSYYLSLPKETNANDTENTAETSVEKPQPADSVAVSASDTSDGAEIFADGDTFPLTSMDLSAKDGEIRINNDTSYTVSAEEYLAKDFPIAPIVPFDSPDKPKVLIVHTHGTEGFTSVDADRYPKDELSPRTTDTTKNVVGLGTELADALNSYGIPTVHCEIMHDEKSFLSAYSQSAKSIAEYIEKYPSIEYVIDLHRDSIVRTTNEKIKPAAEICGEKTAQIMFVIGTDDGGASHPEWRKNLTAALTIQKRIAYDYPSLVRPLNLRSSRFNQQFTQGSFILEVGSCGNTYEEASRAVKLFASSFSRAVTR